MGFGESHGFHPSPWGDQNHRSFPLPIQEVEISRSAGSDVIPQVRERSLPLFHLRQLLFDCLFLSRHRCLSTIG